MIGDHILVLGSAATGGLLREKTLVGRIGWFVPLLPFVALFLWSVFRLAQSVWQHRWRRDGWYARLFWTSLYAASGLWVWAITRGGLTPGDLERTCGAAGQSFNESYYQSHQGPWPPLLNSVPCNRNYDLVASWINPTIVICLLLAIAAFVALVLSTISPPLPAGGPGSQDPDGRCSTEEAPPHDPNTAALDERPDQSETHSPGSRWT